VPVYYKITPFYAIEVDKDNFNVRIFGHIEVLNYLAIAKQIETRGTSGYSGVIDDFIQYVALKNDISISSTNLQKPNEVYPDVSWDTAKHPSSEITIMVKSLKDEKSYPVNIMKVAGEGDKLGVEFCSLHIHHILPALRKHFEDLGIRGLYVNEYHHNSQVFKYDPIALSPLSLNRRDYTLSKIRFIIESDWMINSTVDQFKGIKELIDREASTAMDASMRIETAELLYQAQHFNEALSILEPLDKSTDPYVLNLRKNIEVQIESQNAQAASQEKRYSDAFSPSKSRLPI